MIHLEATEFTLSVGNFRVIWKVLTTPDEEPTPQLAVEELVGKLGIAGLENIVLESMESEESIGVSVADWDGNDHGLEFNPWEYGDGCMVNLDLLVRRIDRCLKEFLEIQRNKNAENIN